MRIDARQLARDYGIDVTTPVGVARHIHEVRPEGLKIISAGHYVGAVRRLARRRGVELPADGRLIAAGYCRVSPTEWLDEASPRGLAAWMQYWESVAARPHIVGSSYNPDIDCVAAAWWRGLPVGLARLVASESAETIARVTMRGLRRRADVRRAIERTSLLDDEAPMLGNDALRALGRLSPELQRVALHALRNDPRWSIEIDRNCRWVSLRDAYACGRTGYHTHVSRRIYAGTSVPGTRPTKIRARDLPWEVVAQAQRMMTAVAPAHAGVRERRRVKERAILAQLWAARGRRRDALEVRLICPAFPRLPLHAARRIASGESPRELSGGHLTRREAHEWCLAGAPGYGDNLLAGMCSWLTGIDVNLLSTVREPSVFQWIMSLHRRGRLESLTRMRTMRVRGRQYTYRYLDRIDELRPDDIVDDPSPDVAFRRAVDRLSGVSAAAHDWTPYAHIPDWVVSEGCVEVLYCPALVVAEGRRQHHCAANYARALRDEVIVSIDYGGARSTALVALDHTLSVRQHYGMANSMVPPGHALRLAEWIHSCRCRRAKLAARPSEVAA